MVYVLKEIAIWEVVRVWKKKVMGSKHLGVGVKECDVIVVQERCKRP
jgi:hypothetical protein